MSRTSRNFLLALILAIPLSLVATAVYIFYPLIWATVTSHEGAGIGAGFGAATGILLLLGALLLLIIFALLQWKTKGTTDNEQ
jgi:hypothetical protein